MKNRILPTITVVIPAYNEEGFLAECLKSLQNQTYKPQEIIVVDNNSTDKTSLIAQEYGAKVVFEPQIGLACARQKGFLAACSDIIATTDADTVVPPDWLTTIAQKFAKNKRLVMLGGLFLYRDGSPLLRIIGPLFHFLTMYPFKAYSGANLAVARNAFEKVSHLDTCSALDIDTPLGRRLRKFGKVKLNPLFVVRTSARRYQNGMLIGQLSYLKSLLATKFFHRKAKFAHIPVRCSADLPKPNPFLVIAVTVIISLLGFLFIPTNPIHAKVETVRKKVNQNVTLTFKKGTKVIGNGISEEISDASQTSKKLVGRLHHHVHH